jgi:hypothetical protein
VILNSETVGNDAGWHLRFFTQSDPGAETSLISVGAGDYYAKIEAALPSGLEGGTYHFTIEGITNNDYKQLHQVWSKSPRVPILVDLYLYWRDVGGPLGFLTSVAGLTDVVDSLSRTPDPSSRVARLVVTRLSRRVGARRFEAVIEATERVYDALGKRVSAPPPPATDPVAAAGRVAEDLLRVSRFSRAVQMHPLEGAGNGAAAPAVELRSFKTGLRLLGALESAMVAQSKRAGRGMYLIRDGQLHIGPGRPIPLEGDPKSLDDVGGLVHVETSSVSQNERAADGEDDGPPARLQYQLTLKGRPDLRPGDRVTFRDPMIERGDGTLDSATSLGVGGPPADFGAALRNLGTSVIGLAPAAVGVDVDLYVSGVSHTLSRTEGFVTSVTGVRVTPGQEWDPAGQQDGSPDPDPPATPHAAVANAIQQLMQTSGSEELVVGEVRAVTTAGTGEPPGQTVDVWAGLVGSDGAPRGARRLPIDRASRSRLTGVPYVTPFAWGKCGLVVPRYPGTRVLVGHVGGAAEDPVDIGALWESGHGPDTQPGDWWLILPAAVESSHRQSATDDETPQEPTSQATNDLIDADGARVIEVGRFTVRVRPGTLGAPGDRPEPPSDSAEQVTIEHESGSRIVIKDNGDIVIDSAKDLTVTAKSTLTLEADDVRVKVKNTMDVIDR